MKFYKYFSIFLIYILTGSNAFSAKPYIQIKQLNPDIKIPSFQKKIINRMSIEIIVKSGNFNLILNSPNLNKLKNSKLKHLKLEFNISLKELLERDKVYDLEYKIVNTLTKKSIKIARRKGILGRRLLYHSRFLLYQLFFGKDYLKKNRKKIERESRQHILPPKSTSQPETPDKVESESAAYQKEIEKLKKKINESKKKVNADNKESKQIEKKIPNKNLTKTQRKKKAKFRINNYSSLKAGYRFKSVDSKVKLNGTSVGIRSDFELLDLSYYLQISPNENSTTFLVTSARLSKVLTSDNHEIPAPFMGLIGIKKYLTKNKIFFMACLAYESSSYISIGSIGADLSTATQKVTSFKLTTNFDKKYFGSILDLRATFSKSLSGETSTYSDEKNKSLTSNGFQLEGIYKYNEQFEFSGFYAFTQTEALQSSNLLITEKSTGFNLTYSY